jgi:TolA-binding protein
MVAGLPAASHAQAQAQSLESPEMRLRRIEAELRAVQRKVFPEAAGKTFAPEITPGVTAAAPVASGGSAINDLLSRMDAVETQIKALTAQGEENQNRLNKLEARIAALEPAVAPAAEPTTPATPPVSSVAPVAAKPVTLPVAKPAAQPAADRVAAVRAIEKLQTADKGEDEYTYGYRLWEAKFFPEAQQQLTQFVQNYAKHKRISYARNLLGRSYLDDGKPGMAAQWFVQNYQADKKGDRAADSLLYLGVAMARLKETKRACAAFSELREVYPDAIVGRLKTQYEGAIKPVTCN